MAGKNFVSVNHYYEPAGLIIFWSRFELLAWSAIVKPRVKFKLESIYLQLKEKTFLTHLVIIKR